MVVQSDLQLPDGRGVHFYDAAAETDPAGLAVFWHHGTPNVGAPPEPLFEAAAERGLRWLSYDRPGYGGSTMGAARDVASAAADVAAIADAVGIDKFAVMGHSGGGPHALACAALWPGRVVATVSVSGLAPYGVAELDWFAGMATAGAAELGAAVAGREALEQLLASTDFDPEQFTPADFAALNGEWAWLNNVAGQGLANGPGGMVADDLAYVAPWGFDIESVRSPVLYVQGSADRIVPSAHARWLAGHTADAELWIRPGEGHVSVLNSAVAALDWLVQKAL